MEMTEKWMSLERKTLKQRQEAEQFYEKNLMKLIEKDYVERNAEKVYESAKYLIMSVGMSYEPIVYYFCARSKRKNIWIR